MSAAADLIIRNGTVYDGTGAPPRQADLVIRAGRIEAIEANSTATASREIDAGGCWVAPGAIDIHTHYDAEVEHNPALTESMRHGVTSVIFGNCSLSAAVGDADDIADMFSRVENLPRHILERWFSNKDWNTPAEYYAHLEKLPLGINVATFLGHSNLRLGVLGKQRCLAPTTLTWGDKSALRTMLSEALDAGFLGLSVDMLQWHRWKGFKYNGASAPSHYATMAEFRLLADVLRQHGRVMQATPDAGRRHLIPILAMLSSGIRRKPMKLSMLTSLDFTANRRLGPLTQRLASVINGLFRGDMRFQSLAVPFELWSDGCNTPVFEEMHASACLMNADTRSQREALYRDSDWRAQMRQEWLKKFNSSFHKDLSLMTVVACPDGTLVNRTFADIARERGTSAVDTFINLIAEFDESIRWHTVIANDRPAYLRQHLKHPYIQLGFSDAGAHNRNMAFQNSHLWFLRDAMLNDDAMPVEKAIWRITGELADWFGLDTGKLAAGRPADIMILDPAALATDLTGPQETNDPGFDNAMRMVSESGKAVRQVIVSGHVAMDNGTPHAQAGKQAFGRLLRTQLRG
ncbi:hypothetical protein K8B33_01230 [Alcanivorax sp. JB21]|uniref:N-acyl-D-amino-acid deacylase family protein n=1 Tax=Alcanivorax limicola TaxID=2874102 RepID=UPI001CBDCA33|nr:hypothetical protein [Alcanivorax limicola]MBZ2187707.1 hypothetical protein [Alcanivorax limicola]